MLHVVCFEGKDLSEMSAMLLHEARPVYGRAPDERHSAASATPPQSEEMSFAYDSPTSCARRIRCAGPEHRVSPVSLDAVSDRHAIIDRQNPVHPVKLLHLLSSELKSCKFVSHLALVRRYAPRASAPSCAPICRPSCLPPASPDTSRAR